MRAPERLVDVPTRKPSRTGYVQRTGRPRVKESPDGLLYSSVRLNLEERELLERLAVTQDRTFADIWRQALRDYGSRYGLWPAAAAAGEEDTNDR